MVSLNSIIYCLGNNEEKPLTIIDMSIRIEGAKDKPEGNERKNRYNRIRSFLVAFHQMFIRSGRRGNYCYSLSYSGKKRFDFIKDKYDLLTDTLLE